MIKHKCKATDYINQTVSVTIDRPLGSKHPKYGFEYPVNYGFIPNTISGDAEELDAYILGINTPLKEFTGTCIAVIQRKNDNDDKLIVVPQNLSLSNEQIEEQTHFQDLQFHRREE